MVVKSAPVVQAAVVAESPVFEIYDELPVKSDSVVDPQKRLQTVRFIGHLPDPPVLRVPENGGKIKILLVPEQTPDGIVARIGLPFSDGVLTAEREGVFPFGVFRMAVDPDGICRGRNFQPGRGIVPV